MTATMNPSENGRKERRCLSTEIDRLDSILDGLDQALQGAITDAVKEAVSVAVTEAVHRTVIEIVSHPQILQLLRGTVPTPSPAPSPTPSNSATARPVRRAWRWATTRLQGGFAAAADRVRAVRATVAGTCRQANAIWALKRPVAIALGVGAVVGMAAYASSPWLAGVVSGLSATGAALGMQLAIFFRRLFAAPAH